jgi:3-hydroxyacyl-CoA dehydrogenase
MGSGIAIAALDFGFDVILLERDAPALEKGVDRIHSHYARRVRSGKIEAIDVGPVSGQF